MEIYALQVNHLSNPLGYALGKGKLSFSWKVKDAKGKSQTYARVRIAADEAMQEILFDSGEDREANSLGYKIDFKTEPRTRYYWTLELASDADEVTVSAPQFFETAKMDEAWIGRWITCATDQARHPYFVKDIAAKEEVVRARLYVCGLGLYEAYWDDKKISNEYLTPYQNNYNRWVQYQTYDVTEQVKDGGKLRILLGNGWYGGRFGFSAHEEKGYFGNAKKLIAEVVVTYADGTEEIIGTDETWQVERSRITYSSIYDGEHMDQTLTDLAAEPVILCRTFEELAAAGKTDGQMVDDISQPEKDEQIPRGHLTARYSLPVVVHEQVKPQELLHTPKGEDVFDMGQNFAGIFTLRVHEARGTKIHIQTGEVLQDGCFYNENLRSAKSEYIYICGGGEEVIKPHFTFYGYRYVKVTGVSNLKTEDFTGLALYSEVAYTGDIATGHKLVNQLISNVRWGMKGNFVDVPTDCPQRDERMGWTGDTQVFSPTATFYGDTYAFYRKYLHDMYTEQMDLEGMVPDVVPSVGVHTCACVWGDAACIIPWNMYKFYGDEQILADQYESMKAWVEYIRRLDGDDHGWRHVFHYGDWLALDNPSGKADEVMGGTEEGYIANIYYAASAEIVAKAAEVLGKEDDAKEYNELAKREFAEVKKEYFSQMGRCCIKTQTGLLLALKYGLSDNVALTRDMLKKLFTANDNKLQTGFTGMPIMCPTLSDNGMNDLAYTLLLNEEYPGWLHEILLGATTVWERWNSLDEEGHISSTGMNSLNHYSYGSVVEWIYRYVLGFRVDEADPGAKHLRIAPSYNWDLKEAAGNFDSAAGNYKVEWKIIGPTQVSLSVQVPFDASADIVLADAVEDTYADKENPLFADVCDGVCHVGSGTYEITYQVKTALKKSYSTYSTVRELRSNAAIVKNLGEKMGLDRMPTQMMDMSLRDIMEKYAGAAGMGTEMLDQLDQVLARF